MPDPIRAEANQAYVRRLLADKQPGLPAGSTSPQPSCTPRWHRAATSLDSNRAGPGKCHEVTGVARGYPECPQLPRAAG